MSPLPSDTQTERENQRFKFFVKTGQYFNRNIYLVTEFFESISAKIH
ncbi:hypothetical protein FM107_09700 [Sphingobacterium sp. JB170]|nr:hypothetical protein FM107_09700 [Sphingobacterium sp. JB170]